MVANCITGEIVLSTSSHTKLNVKWSCHTFCVDSADGGKLCQPRRSLISKEGQNLSIGTQIDCATSLFGKIRKTHNHALGMPAWEKPIVVSVLPLRMYEGV